MGGGGVINPLTVMAAFEAVSHLARLCARMTRLLVDGRVKPCHDNVRTL
jgi:hypothetical protein